MFTPSPADIAAAAKRIAPHIRRTPILDLPAGALGFDHTVALKLEHLQLTGSFKIRGAFNNLLSREVPEAGVVAFSGGNHGAAVACAATALGHRSVIFVPKPLAKSEKIERMERFGAEVRVIDKSSAEVMVDYETHAADTGALAVHPYDGAWTLAGQGTVARELEREIDGLDTVLVATGGGGLIGGVAAWFGDRVNVVSVETRGTNTLARSLAEGPEIDVRATGIAASSLGGPAIGALAWPILRDRVRTALVLEDQAVIEAGQRLWEDARITVEPGGAVALAALTSGAYRPEPDERVAVLLCGGNATPGWQLGW
ncbi:pyridoxal-phosphate dependent enzyme [Rhodobacterales bacterium HKCCE2091]|nr:pyridoxal-phosphate dependent enzyme [Rhodobacterales bacterium HKCCE2091]